MEKKKLSNWTSLHQSRNCRNCRLNLLHKTEITDIRVALPDAQAVPGFSEDLSRVCQCWELHKLSCKEDFWVSLDQSYVQMNQCFPLHLFKRVKVPFPTVGKWFERFVKTEAANLKAGQLKGWGEVFSEIPADGIGRFRAEFACVLGTSTELSLNRCSAAAILEHWCSKYVTTMKC